MSSEPEPAVEDDDAWGEFLVALGGALLSHGTPAHRLEQILGEISRQRAVAGQFFSTPTMLIAGLSAGRGLSTRMVRVNPGETNLEKLVLLDQVASAVVHRRIDVQSASARIAAIVAAPSRHRTAVRVAAFGISSAAAAVVLGGGKIDVAVAAAIGLLLGIIARLAAATSLGRVTEVLVAAAGSLLASGVAVWFPPASLHIVTLAGLIVFLPGLTLTTAMAELATGNLVSGNARLMYAVIVFVQLAFGVVLGTRVAELLWGTVPVAQASVPLGTMAHVVALFVAPIAFGVLFRARPRDMPAIVVSGLLAFAGARIGAATIDPVLGVWVGATIVGLYANLFSRVFDEPASVVLVPGLITLVPGSLGFHSVSAMLRNDVMAGVETAWTMVIIAGSLAIGLLVANALMPPRKAL